MFVLKYLTVLFIHFASSESAIVNTQNGQVEGSLIANENGILYHNFQSIPYARPPIGDLMFRDALPPVPWLETLNCSVQRSPFWGPGNGENGAIGGDFDALHINVYTNNINPDTKYPVMVWLHGGGWQVGSSTTDIYGPDFLIEYNVTVVTLNYRLGVYGFLSLDDRELNVPGNQAFKDQRLALKWVQNNIANFGGDPDLVTLFGQSSGGGSVHYHMISEGSRGLFKHGILMAGSALHNGYSSIPRLNWGQRLVSRLGLNTTSDAEILAFLESANPVDVITQQLQLLTIEESMNQAITIPFGPTIEPYVTDGVFLSEDIPTLVRNAWGNTVKLLIGAVSMESLEILPFVQAIPSLIDTFGNFEIYIPRELNVKRESDESREYAEMLQQTYYGLMTPSVTNIDGIMSAFADSYLWYPALRTVRYRLESDVETETYVYRFDADSEFNVFNHMLLPSTQFYREPAHCDDFAHLFKTSFHKPMTEVNQTSIDTLHLMLSMFTNFALTGNPSTLNTNWPAIEALAPEDSSSLVGLNIKENGIEFKTLPEAARVRTFDKIFEMERSTTNSAASFVAAFNVVLITFLIL